MKLLITGALGHIGSKFIHSIVPNKYDEVVLLDNLSSQRYCSLFNLPKNVNFKFIEDDICTADLCTIFEGMDIVVHLAAITDAANSFELEHRVFHVNYAGTSLVAKACMKNNCKLFFVSTTSVYGVQENLVDESCPEEWLKPQSPYASSKLKSEKMLQQLENLKYTICRFGTIYGTSIGMRFHTAVNKFCWQACMKLPITVWSTALNQVRPYLCLTDAVEAINFIIDNNYFNNQLYNVVTDNFTVNDILHIISTYIPGIEIKYVNTEIMNQLSYRVSNLKFKELGFNFSGNIEQNVKETICLLHNGLKI